MSRHGGHIHQLAGAAGIEPGQLLDFSANINPLGPPAAVRPAAIRALDMAFRHYPDPDCAELTRILAARWGCRLEELVPTNGASEALYALPRALPGVTRALLLAPAYVDYRAAATAAGWEIRVMPLKASQGFQINWQKLEKELSGGEAVFIGRPGNPAGAAFDLPPLRKLLAARPDTWFIIDEAFIEFTERESLAADLPANAIVLRSLTKFYALPGLRLGAVIAPAPVARRLRQCLPTWSVNTIAQQAGIAALADEDYAVRSRQAIAEWREQLQTSLRKLPKIGVFNSEANYLLCKLTRTGAKASELAKKLLEKHRIAIRVCGNYEALDPSYFRIAVRTPEENDQLLRGLRAELCPGLPAIVAPYHTPAIMFQGTSSNAGKSVLAAGFCRILLQEGYRVAPFKSQNMSLNSYVTAAGGEMGRAQVTQALACRREPDVRMNPILLKPNSDTGSQIIVNGRPVGSMKVYDYIRYKPQAFAIAKAAYDSLAAECDAMVIEGAGSPAEVNLKPHDIVNMAMARHAKAPVLLVGDIDRGGIFASFLGTMDILDDFERRLVAGYVINRFRGDPTLLGPAIDYVAQETGKPTLGIIPYLHDLGLPEEDSVSLKNGLWEPKKTAEGPQLDIAVIDLPHISNFTDFDALRIEPDVQLRLVRDPAKLGHPDAVILPGSKNTLGDLAALNASGMAAALLALAEQGKTEIVGICGGFQMLGQSIGDPHEIESAGPPQPGFGLIATATMMHQEKTLTRRLARHAPSGLDVYGYEIHHGQSAGSATPLFPDVPALGAGNASGRVWGSYLHGLFDADPFRRWWLDTLRVRRGLPALLVPQACYNIDAALDRLAQTLRDNMDVAAILRSMGR